MNRTSHCARRSSLDSALPARRFALHATLFAAVVCVGGCSREGSRSTVEPHPLPAIETLLEAFERVPLVGLGEAHGLQEQHDFIASLIRHPDFAATVDDIVVEFGSARYQHLIDRYVAGESVNRVELRKVWRNTTQTVIWDSPIYERFFDVIREVNQSHPPEEQLRVLLADPPIDWDSLRTARAFLDWYEHNGRNAHAARVVENEVLRKGRKALVIAGTGHLMRPTAEWRRQFPDGGPNETGYIEARHPGSMFLVMVHAGPAEDFDPIERRIATWPVPSVALLEGTWLGEVEWGDARLGEMWDAYLYLGPGSSLTMSVPSPEIYEDEAYLNDLERRHQLLYEAGRFQHPFDRAWLLRERSTRFLDQFD